MFAKQLGSRDVLDAVVAAAESRLAATTEDAPDVAKVRTDLSAVEQEITNVTEAIAAGGSFKSLLAALSDREEKRDALQRQLRDLLRRQSAVSHASRASRAELARRLADWQGILLRRPEQARAILKMLLVGPLVFTPKTDGTDKWFEFSGRASFALENQACSFGGVPNGSRTRVLALKVKKSPIRQIDDQPTEIIGSCAASAS